MVNLRGEKHSADKSGYEARRTPDQPNPETVTENEDQYDQGHNDGDERIGTNVFHELPRRSTPTGPTADCRQRLPSGSGLGLG